MQSFESSFKGLGRTFSACVVSVCTTTVTAQGLGVYPDCNEKKITIEKIKEIAAGKSEMVAFLKALPKDALQTFTFVPGTRSSQHHLVDDQWPRVLRMSADGKIVLSFVCNKQSQDYGGVEILHFEDAHAQWRSVSLHFEKKELNFQGVPASISHGKINQDPSVCLKCHGVGSGENRELRAIFPPYPTWTGFYGSDDDGMFKGEREQVKYQQFKALAATDPCFQTLPWPKKLPSGYEEYPYNAITRPVDEFNPMVRGAYLKKLKIDNYHIRSNLKFTDALSHLNARRLAYKYLRSQAYLKVSPLLAMEALGCTNLDLDQNLASVLGSKYKKPSFNNGSSMDPRSTTSRTLRLYTVGQLLGIEPEQWTLHLGTPREAEYATGIHGYYGNDISMAQITQGLLFAEVAKMTPELKGKFKLSRGVSEFFKGQNFSCVDDLGGAVIFETADQSKMCAALAKIYYDNVGQKIKPQEPGPSVPLPTAADDLIAKISVTPEFSKLQNNKLVKAGEKAVQTYCTSCHNSNSYLPAAYHFFASKQAFERAVKADPFLLPRALAYIENKRMPIGYTLDDSTRLAAQAYLFKISKETVKEIKK